MNTNTESEKSRIIEMAWEDRTPFDIILSSFDMTEKQLIHFMRTELSRGAFKVWRKRHKGRTTKHLKLRPEGVMRSHCKTQYKHK
jgi:uncharacterized protein (TIGR03643 family)